MAMTKKERAEFDAAIKQAQVLGALHFTAKVAPDMPIPKSGTVKGWMYRFARGWSSSSCVEPSCSTHTAHGFGQNVRTTSQHGMPQYSTKMRALKALRNEMEQEYAEQLRKVDLQIAAEQ